MAEKTYDMNYDRRHDTFRIQEVTSRDAYADEDGNGIVAFRYIDDDSIAGFMIYDFIKRIGIGIDMPAIEQVPREFIENEDW